MKARPSPTSASFLAGAAIALVAWACVDQIRGCAARTLHVIETNRWPDATPTMRALLHKIGA